MVSFSECLLPLGSGEINNYGMEVDQDDENNYDEGYDYVDLDNLPNDQEQYFLQKECNNGSDFQNEDEVLFNESMAL